MAEPRYGYNAQGNWTILQPGEAEWNPDPQVALFKLYGNDTTSLMGNYYNAGGNILGQGAGGLISASGASPQNTSARDIVYEYTRPWTPEEQLKNRNAQQDWSNMFMNSKFWNPNDANSYAIQNEPIQTNHNNVSDTSKWKTWATNNSYIAPDKLPVRNNSSEPVRTSGGLVNLPGEQTPNIVAPNSGGGLLNTTNLPTNNSTSTGSNSPYLARMSNSNMAYSGAPRYNDIAPSTGQQSNTGLMEATKMPQLGTPTRQGSVDFSRALWR
jgi:hypothetical protein